MLGFLKRRRHPMSEADLSAYVDGRVSPDERLRLEEHLRSCPACTRKLEGLRTVVAELRHLPPRRRAALVRPHGYAGRDWLGQAAGRRDCALAGSGTPLPRASRWGDRRYCSACHWRLWSLPSLE